MPQGRVRNRTTPNAFRQLHRRIKKWAKDNGHDWEVLETRSGWKYKLDGKIVASSHRSSFIDRNFKADLRRAGIPREVIGIIVMPGSFSGYELPDGMTPHWTNNLSANLRDAKVGELIWVRGHDVLVVGRIEQPDITKNCRGCRGCGSMKDFLESGFTEVFGEDWKETQEPVDFSAPEFDGIPDDGTCPCVEIGVVVQFLPNGMKQRYEHQFPPYEEK